MPSAMNTHTHTLVRIYKCKMYNKLTPDVKITPRANSFDKVKCLKASAQEKSPSMLSLTDVFILQKNKTQLCFPGGGQIARKLHRCRKFQPNSCGFKPLKPQLATSLTVFGAQDKIHSNMEMVNNKDVFFFLPFFAY